jgi:HflK protein
MIAFFTEWASALWVTLCDAGFYLLLGLTIAGFIQALVPRDKVLRHFGGDDFLSVLKASLAGIPVPLCSCSVIPTAVQLRKSGASKGATSAFLISTPETGVDSIGITWALLDPLMTVARPLAALVTAVGTGSAVNWLVKRKWDGKGSDDVAVEHAHAHGADDASHAGHDHARETKPEAGCGDSTCADSSCPPAKENAPDANDTARTDVIPARAPRGFAATCREAFAYAFGSLLDDLAGWLILSFVLSALILIVVPDNFFGGVLPAGWPSMLLMLLIGMPLYVCASATTPIAAALIAKGLDPGAAMVLLLAGPATNLATMAVVSRFLGRRVLVVYLVGIASLSLLCGAIVSRIYARIGPMKVRALQDALTSSPGWFAMIGAVVIVYFLARSAHRTRLVPEIGRVLRGWCAPLGFDPSSTRMKRAVVAAALLLYASTAFSWVSPGETAFVLRFGDLREQIAIPGLSIHAPYPIDRVEILRTDEVRAATFGFDEGAVKSNDGRDREAESEMVTGDENLLRITYAVHYRVSDARKFSFGLADPDKALRVAAETSARRMVGHRRAEALLVESRDAMQREMLQLLGEELGTLDVGIEPVAVHLVYVHVPSAVHGAYLDVASALEDKEGTIRDAEKYKAEREARARAQARATEEGAAARQVEILAKAQGAASAFAARLDAYHVHPDIDRKRRLREMLASALGKSSLVLLLAPDVDVRILDGANRDPARDNGTPSNAPTPVPGMDDR